MAGILLAALALQAAAEGVIDGRWVNPKSTVIIEIAPCGEVRCGTVVWASDKAKSDAAKGTAQLVGSQLLSELRPGKDGAWQGKLFVPDQNIRVKAKLVPVDGGIRVSGCSLALFCKSQRWVRSDK